MRLIDADACLIDAWQRFYKQEDKHEKEIDDYDILRDRFYEQSGFECCQQAIVDAPTVQVAEKYEQFAEWVAKEIFDENIEMSFDAFAEVACRKLEKLGIVKANGNMWELIKGA